MYQDSNEHTDALLDEAMGLKGMIAEVQSKAQLLKSRMQREEKEQYDANELVIPSESLCEDVTQSVSQMRDDLAKYSQRLKEIHEELASYGINSNF